MSRGDVIHTLIPCSSTNRYADLVGTLLLTLGVVVNLSQSTCPREHFPQTHTGTPNTRIPSQLLHTKTQPWVIVHLRLQRLPNHQRLYVTNTLLICPSHLVDLLMKCSHVLHTPKHTSCMSVLGRTILFENSGQGWDQVWEKDLLLLPRD
jgi:hypothetical protein